MSNPVGDDSGREWVEVYNNTSLPVDLSSLSMSIKGATPVGVVPVQGGTMLAPSSYAIISSIVSASSPVSKFLDTATGYPSYTGILVRSASSISLVNTGTTSLDIRLNGTVVDTLSAYTPAAEGKTLSLIGGSFVVGTPTPGADNQAASSNTTVADSITTTGSQSTVAQTAPPSADIVLYVPQERFVVAGADAIFSVYALTKAGNAIDTITASWAYGDGGQKKGTSTEYAYAYPGDYLARVEAGNSSVMGVASIHVKVVTPEIVISSVGIGKYGSYVDVYNPNEYDLDVSQWRLSIDTNSFPFPKNTIFMKKSTTRLSGRAMGFASTTFIPDMIIQMAFPNQEVITKYAVPQMAVSTVLQSSSTLKLKPSLLPMIVKKIKQDMVATSTTQQTLSKQGKDTRLVSWVKSMF
jgi:hypothetical protein